MKNEYFTIEDIHPPLEQELFEHFQSEILYVEVMYADVKILFDGGGWKHRNKTMFQMLSNAFALSPLPTRARFWIFTGDTRPAQSIKGEPLFSIAGPRSDAEFIIPDPYSFEWSEAGFESFHALAAALCKEANEHLNGDKETINKVFWRGDTLNCPFPDEQGGRRYFKKNLENIDAFDIEHVDSTHKKHYISLLNHCKYKFLLDMPGQGYSARIKILAFACRPLFITPRYNWDWATLGLEPDYHYIHVGEKWGTAVEAYNTFNEDKESCSVMTYGMYKYMSEKLEPEFILNSMSSIFRRSLV